MWGFIPMADAKASFLEQGRRMYEYIQLSEGRIFVYEPLPDGSHIDYFDLFLESSKPYELLMAKIYRNVVARGIKSLFEGMFAP